MSTNHSPNLITEDSLRKAIKEPLPAFEDISTLLRVDGGSQHDVWYVGSSAVLTALPANERSKDSSTSSLRRDSEISELLRRYSGNLNLAPWVHATLAAEGWIGNIEQRIHGKSLDNALPSSQTEEALVNVLKTLAAVPIDDAMRAVKYEQESPNISKRVYKALRAWNELTKSNYDIGSED